MLTGALVRVRHVRGNRVVPVYVRPNDPALLELAERLLLVFRGAEAYVSPNWYPSKLEQHRQVPTWNYQVVHVHGRIHFREDEAFLRGLLARLTRTHEARAGQSPPWRMTDATPDYIAGLLREIVGLEVRVERIVAKSKLSQNKDARDRASVVAAMDATGKADLADAMRRS